MTESAGNVDRADFVHGIGIAFMLQALMPVVVIVAGFAIGLASPLAGIVGFFVPVAAWGASQLIYILPAVVVAKTQGRNARASGICAGAILVVIIHLALMIQTNQIRWK